LVVQMSFLVKRDIVHLCSRRRVWRLNGLNGSRRGQRL
jgi:hypothetical protein